MPEKIHFRNGILDNSGAPAHQTHTVEITDHIMIIAMIGARNAILPPSYPSSAAVQVVPMTSIILDFSIRTHDYDGARLISIIKGIQEGVDLPPLSVTPTRNGLYELNNGYHRFIACALLGFTSIPIDQLAPQAVPQPAVPRYIPPHLR